MRSVMRIAAHTAEFLPRFLLQSECFQHNRKRTVVDKRNFHIGTENAVPDGTETALAVR